MIGVNILSSGKDFDVDGKTIQCLNQMSLDINNIYLVDIYFNEDINQALDSNHILPIDYYSNIYFLGDWDVYTPRTEKILKRYKIDNPYKAMCESHLYLLDNESQLSIKLDYINEQYKVYPNIQCVRRINDKYYLYELNKDRGLSL